VDIDSCPIDSSDEDYQLFPCYTPKAHDDDAGGSSFAPRSSPTLIGLLERLT
jgi:hypothetical protein